MPREFCSKLHPTEVVFEDQYCVIARSKGRYAHGKIFRREYSKAPHVAMEPSEGLRSLETLYLTKHGAEHRIEVSTYTFGSVPLLVAGTNRIATIHRRIARAAQRSLAIKIFKLPFQLPPMQQSVQWHKHRSNDSGLIWLRQMMRDVAEDIG